MPPKKWGQSKPRPKPETDIIYGTHSIIAALANPKRKFKEVLATKNAAAKLQSQFSARGITAQIVLAKDLDRLTGPDAVHQGVVANLPPCPN